MSSNSKKNGKVDSNFAAGKNGQVSTNFAASKSGQFGSNFTADKNGQVSTTFAAGTKFDVGTKIPASKKILLAQKFLLAQKLLLALKLLLAQIFLNTGPRRQSVTCLATDACLTADPGVPSLIAAWSHPFMEIGHEIISTVGRIAFAHFLQLAMISFAHFFQFHLRTIFTPPIRGNY